MKRIIGLLKRNKLYRYLVIVAISYVMAGVVHATEDQPVPNSFSSGDVASSSEVNENFDWLVERSWDLDDTSGTDIYYNVTDGNVGIGTDQPDFKLDVDGGSGTAINAQSIGGNTINATSSAGGGYAAIRASATGSGTYGIWSSSTEYVGGRFESTSGNALEAITDSGNAGIFMGGNVGIGTTSPGADLHLDNYGANSLRINNHHDGYMQFTSQSTNTSNVYAYFVVKPYDSISSTTVMTLRETGNVGIGTYTPNVALDVDGSIEYTGTITDVSDERLKENVHPIDGALDKVEAITGVYFNMIDTPEQTELGVIAQEVQKVLPEAVNVVDEENGYLGVSYTSLVPVLIEAVKALKEKNEALEIENKALKQDVQQIKTALGL